MGSTPTDDLTISIPAQKIFSIYNQGSALFEIDSSNMMTRNYGKFTHNDNVGILSEATSN